MSISLKSKAFRLSNWGAPAQTRTYGCQLNPTTRIGVQTYTVTIVDGRPYLVGDPLLGGNLGLNDSIWRNKPVPGGYGLAVMIGNIEFQCSYFGELKEMLAKTLKQPHSKGNQKNTVTKDIKSSSSPASAKTRPKARDSRSDENSILNEWLGRFFPSMLKYRHEGKVPAQDNQIIETALCIAPASITEANKDKTNTL